MKILIVTPSFRNSNWLKLCIASVADQQGVEVEHIVQDACSDDGTLDWLPGDARVRACIEKDSGMYDAINRGFRKSSAEIVAYLNCDEQFLPGSLKAVHDYFETHPEIDVLVSDTVVVAADGTYLCHRYGFEPGFYSSWLKTSVTTCSLFFRRRVLDKHGIYFDTKWKALGDAFWLIEAVQKKVRFGTLRLKTAIFTETGNNLALKPSSLREEVQKDEMAPSLVKMFRPLLILKHRIKMIASGMFWEKPFTYSIYTLDNDKRRSEFKAEKPTPIWRRPPLASAS